MASWSFSIFSREELPIWVRVAIFVSEASLPRCLLSVRDLLKKKRIDDLQSVEQSDHKARHRENVEVDRAQRKDRQLGGGCADDRAGNEAEARKRRDLTCELGALLDRRGDAYIRLLDGLLAARADALQQPRDEHGHRCHRRRVRPHARLGQPVLQPTDQGDERAQLQRVLRPQNMRKCTETDRAERLADGVDSHRPRVESARGP
mmetsp:Transcript_28420/g.59741  ORF Transcript_28420/g.59741 Transcript_28420/m.59741 type:complete len:205 (-) Transcript_28420:433-1047(-)